jgi:PhzF family phenazine biosynthesis protein
VSPRAAVVNAFVKDGNGGNPAGVVLDADKISDRERQKIAAKLGFSETVFVERLRDVFKLRFFTPTTELDLCGHATIATFGYLFDQHRVGVGRTKMETLAGPLGIEILRDGLVLMEQNRPAFGKKAPLRAVGAALGGAKILDARVVSTGLPDLLAEVESREALLSLKPDLAAIKKLTVGCKATSLHVFAKGAGAVTAYCRDFAPAVGIDEESATGTASGALACHLFDRGQASPRDDLHPGRVDGAGVGNLRAAGRGGRKDRTRPRRRPRPLRADRRRVAFSRNPSRGPAWPPCPCS